MVEMVVDAMQQPLVILVPGLGMVQIQGVGKAVDKGVAAILGDGFGF